MITNWPVVLWPLGIAAAAGLALVGERFWRGRGSSADGKWLDKDIRGRAVAATIMGVVIAAVAFFVEYFSGRSPH